MLYHVSGEYIEGPLLSHQQIIQRLEHAIMPGLEACAKLVAGKKILAGGVVAGLRASMFILEAESHEEVNRILQSLPLWTLNTWKITPLVSFENQIPQVREHLEHLKSTPQ